MPAVCLECWLWRPKNTVNNIIGSSGKWGLIFSYDPCLLNDLNLKRKKKGEKRKKYRRQWKNVRPLLDLTKHQSENQVQLSHFFSTREVLTGKMYEQWSICPLMRISSLPYSHSFWDPGSKCLWRSVSLFQILGLWLVTYLFLDVVRSYFKEICPVCLGILWADSEGFLPISASTLCQDWTKREKQPKSRIAQKAGSAK